MCVPYKPYTDFGALRNIKTNYSRQAKAKLESVLESVLDVRSPSALGRNLWDHAAAGVRHTHTHTRTQARTHTHPIIYMLRRAHTELHGQAHAA